MEIEWIPGKPPKDGKTYLCAFSHLGEKGLCLARWSQMINGVWIFGHAANNYDISVGRITHYTTSKIRLPHESDQKTRGRIDVALKIAKYLGGLDKWVPGSDKEDAQFDGTPPPWSVCCANECGGCEDDNAEPCAEFKKALEDYILAAMRVEEIVRKYEADNK